MGILVLIVGGCDPVPRPELNLLPEPSAEKGVVYFFREKAFQGCAVGIPIYDGSQRIGVLQNGTYFAVEAEPGLHTYVGKTEVGDRLHVDVTAGKSHFVKAGVRLGLFVGQPELSLANETEARTAIEKLKCIAPKR